MDSLASHLAELGFENVSVAALDPGKITVSYENRLYRNEMTALGIVLQEAFHYFAGGKRIQIEIKRLDIPVIAFAIEYDDLQLFAQGRITANDFGRRIEFCAHRKTTGVVETASEPTVANPSLHKVDLLLQPAIGANLGNRDDPYKFKVDFHPAVSTLLTRGLTLHFSLSIPIVDEINFNKESVRLYSATLSFLAPFGRQSFLFNHIGYFADGRYGISSQAAQYLLSGNLAFIGRVDYTGFLSYDDKTWFYSPLHLWTYNFGVQWQFSSYGMRASVQYGRYLLEDRGLRIALGRYLKETRLDFFGSLTSGDRWGGVELAIPLFPNKRFRPRRLRLDVPELYVAKYESTAGDFGESFTIPNDLLEFRGDLTENYIRNHLQELRQCLLRMARPWTLNETK